MMKKIRIALLLITCAVSFSSFFCMERCDKYIQELKNTRYNTSFVDQPILSILIEQQETLVTGWQAATEEIARKDAKLAELTQEIKNRKIDIRNIRDNSPFTARVLQERFDKTQAEFQTFIDAIAEKDAKIEMLIQRGAEPRILRNQLEEVRQQSEQQAQELQKIKVQKEAEIIESQRLQQDLQALAQLQESQKRITSLLALFESSKATGWETTFIEIMKAELGK